MLSAELIFVIALTGFVLLVCVKVYKLGRKTRAADSAEEVLNDVAKVKKARDDLSVSPSKSARVRAKYRR